ncbi:MAG: DUF2461 domain-containing protein [Rikenellaceae bacterium]|nr:DUF2461 domain-containing protein [Rikenellaceae bacterium]
MVQRILDFLAQLKANNNKAWFDAHRSEWEAIRKEHKAFAAELIEAVGEFDPLVRGLRVQDCTYRINRDIRFSPDKSPYKTWMGIYICPKGKCSGYAGYYFHLEPTTPDDRWQNMLAAGLHMPQGAILRSLRDEIFDNGAEIAEAVAEAKGFHLFAGEHLKRTPQGYPAGSEYDDWLRKKDFLLEQHLNREWLTRPNLVGRIAEEFRKTHHLTEILNRAVRYAYEEMM